MTVDIKLPPLPKYTLLRGLHTSENMKEYARAAIEADRQRCGGPVAYRSWRRDIARWEYHSKKTEDITCEPLYAAPQPADPVIKDSLTVPEGWQLVPKELIDFLDAKEHHLPVEDRHVLSIMLAAAPEPPCTL